MENRVEKYQSVQKEIVRLTTILMTQHGVHAEQARQEAIKIEAQTRRAHARSLMGNNWYSWVKDLDNLPKDREENLQPALAWF